MKKRILMLVIACTTMLSMVACGTTASTNDTTKDTSESEVASENEVSEVETEMENIIRNTDWRDMTVVVNGTAITFPCKYGEVHNSGTIVSGGLDFLSPNPFGYGSGAVLVADKNKVFDSSILKANSMDVYYPKGVTDDMESYLFAIDLTVDVATARDIGKGERVNGPIIELPNGLKVGDYVDYSKIVETYGMPTEENTTGQDYEYGTEYVYRSEDGTKVFRVYTASNRLIGFRMWVDSKTYDWYTH